MFARTLFLNAWWNPSIITENSIYAGICQGMIYGIVWVWTKQSKGPYVNFLGSHIHIEWIKSWNKVIIEGRTEPDGTDCLISMVSHMWINFVDEIKRTNILFTNIVHIWTNMILFQKCIRRSLKERFEYSWVNFPYVPYVLLNCLSSAIHLIHSETYVLWLKMKYYLMRRTGHKTLTRSRFIAHYTLKLLGSIPCGARTLINYMGECFH